MLNNVLLDRSGVPHTCQAVVSQKFVRRISVKRRKLTADRKVFTLNQRLKIVIVPNHHLIISYLVQQCMILVTGSWSGCWMHCFTFLQFSVFGLWYALLEFSVWTLSCEICVVVVVRCLLKSPDFHHQS
jgi:hypothetical protein